MKLKSIQIRKVKLSDIDGIIRIYSAIVRSEVDVSLKSSIKKQIKENNCQFNCYVANDGDNIVGFMIGYIMTPAFGIDKSAWISAFGVDPNYMGRHIGKLLAKKLFKFYKKKGIEVIHTSVLWDYMDVLSFFKAIGFKRSRFVELYKKL